MLLFAATLFYLRTSPNRAGGKRLMTRLNADHRKRLIRLLASMPIFSTQRSRSQIFEFAGLSELIPLVNLEGEPFVVASHVIQTLESYGRVSYEHDALGVFLSSVEEFLGGSNSDRLFLQLLLKQYNLMTPVKAPEEITEWQ